ncbi:MAG: ATP-dependent zinc metalloprotease FtsH [Planctomycetia bacterium]|nr:ATP-dependent zinc metalloprotease FtsH [Planctomycetia bacterium]
MTTDIPEKDDSHSSLSDEHTETALTDSENISSDSQKDELPHIAPQKDNSTDTAEDKTDILNEEKPKNAPSEKSWNYFRRNHFPIYVILTIFASILLANLLFQNTLKKKIRYMDLVRLIEQGSPDVNPNAMISVTQEDKKIRRITHYWNLHDVIVGQNEITGKICFQETTQKITPEITPENTPVKSPSEQTSEESKEAGSSQFSKISPPKDISSENETLSPEATKTSHETAPSASENTSTSDTSISEVPSSETSLNTPPNAETIIKKDQKPVPFITNRYGISDDGGFLLNLLKEHGFKDADAEAPPSFLASLLHTMIFLIFIAILFYLMITRFGNAGAVAFGRNRGRFYNRDELNVTFDDVAGVDEAVDELREVVDFLREPEKFHALGGKIPRGILLVGPPGTGKTLLAKAVAGEANVPFLSLSGSDFVEMYVGVGAARVRSMFQDALAHSPCIIFIDELDALGKTRGSAGQNSNDEREQTLNALLVELDGFAPNSGVIVLAATNRPEMLDPALLRPGRFDRQVLVDRPDKAGREKILQVHSQEVKLSPEVNLSEIATMTAGFAGADLANLVNEAALLAARQGKSEITMRELNEAVERVTAGLEKRSRVLNDKTKHRVAVHESAHALIAHILPDASKVHKVSIIPRGMAALGFTMQLPEEDRYLVTHEELKAEIYVLLAGTIGEELVFQSVSTGASNDLQRATNIARSIVMDYGMSTLGRLTFRDRPHNMLGTEEFYPREYSESTAREIDLEIRRILENSEEHVRQLLKEHRNTLDVLSQRLLLDEVMNADTLKEIVDTPGGTPENMPENMPENTPENTP